MRIGGSERRAGRRCAVGADDGASMVVTLAALLVVAVLTAIGLGATLHPGSGASPSEPGAPAVATADAVQAQQSLATGLSDASTAAATQGGYGAVTASALAGAEPSLTFVDGPSTNATTVSVAVTGGSGIGSTTGSITLADRASDGNCWLVWRAAGAATWYGTQRGLASCTAPALDGPPTPGAVSASEIGWQEGSFPAP